MTRATIRPLSARTEANLVAWCTSNDTYLVTHFMIAAPCFVPRVFDKPMVAARGVLSPCVMLILRRFLAAGLFSHCNCNRFMSLEQLVDDAEVIVQHLLARLEHEKLIAMGCSFGSEIGPLLVEGHPEWFHAYVGCGQSNGASNEPELFRSLMERVHAANDSVAIRELLANAGRGQSIEARRNQLSTRDFQRAKTKDTHSC